MPVWVSSNLLILFTAGFCFWASLAALLPTLPLYVSDIGGSQQQVGLVMGAFAIGLITARPKLGQLADHNSRKLVLLIGITVAAIAPFSYIFSQNITTLFGIRAFHGISIAAFATAYNALVVDLAAPNKRGEIIGYMSLVNPFGVAVGPALGGWVLEIGGYSWLFGTAALLGSFGFFMITQVHDPSTGSSMLGLHKKQPNVRPKRKQAQYHPPQTSLGSRLWQFPLKIPHLTLLFIQKSMIWQPRLRIPTLILLCIGLTFGTLATFMPLFVKQLEIDFNPGLYYTAAAIASFTVRILTGPASDRLGRGRFISLSLLCYMISMLLLWQSTSAEMFLLSGFFEGAGGGLLIPMVAALMADRAADHERAQIFSVCMGGFDIGLAIAGPVFGSFSELIPLRYVFLLAAVLCGFALCSFLGFSNNSFKRSLQFSLSNGQDSFANSDQVS